MLYCLSRDIFDDLVAVKNHEHSKYDGTNACHFVLDNQPKECKLVSTLPMILAAARQLRDRMEWQNASLIARMWVSTMYPFSSDVIDLDFKHQDIDEGYWEYWYASLGAKKLFISKGYFSNAIKVNGGVPRYCIDDGLSVKEYTLSEIEQSNQYFKLSAVFPAEPRMFADDNAEYMIPYNII